MHVVIPISHSRLYSPYRSDHHPPSLSFSSTTLPSSQEHKVKSSLSISHCHHHDVTLSAAYTEYSIRRVKHTPSPAYTQDFLLSVHSQKFKLTHDCRSSFRHTSLLIESHQPVLHKSIKGKVTLSHSHSCELTNWWIESWCAVHRPHPKTHPISLNHGLHLFLPTPLITASKCISKLARSGPQSASPNMLDYGTQLHLQSRSITALEYTSQPTQPSISGAPHIAPKLRLQPVQIYCV